MTDLIAQAVADRDRFEPGSLEWEWRTRAAWKLVQIRAGIAPKYWTPPPADFGAQNCEAAE